MHGVIGANEFVPSQEELCVMLEIMRDRIAALKLDLSGLRVITEAATGAYACTAVIAAMAGARTVHAVARDTARHGSAADAFAATSALARLAGVENRIVMVRQLRPEMLASCDILTNSGHLRPITREMIERLPPAAVISLMFEAWEFRGTDLDIEACRRRGMRIAAVNERHRDVAVFPFLGPLCVKLLGDAGMEITDRHVALLCDNPFSAFIESGLKQQGAKVDVFVKGTDLPREKWDAVVVALHPDGKPLDRAFFRRLAQSAPRALVAQFWGDIDRRAVESFGLPICPHDEPRPGHMGILLNALGPEPIVRLQAGGLRAAELVSRGGGGQDPSGIAQLL